MYWPDVVDIKAFYASSLGGVVCRRLRGKIKSCWPGVFEENTTPVPLKILGIGYTNPYLQKMLNSGNSITFSLMPSSQGVIHWPENGKNLSFLAKEVTLPFDDDCIDRIIVAHSLEFTKHPVDMMDEIFRVLSPNGKLLIIAPNRNSIWARREISPFGYGHPYSVTQLEQLLRDSLFNPITVETALFFPPTRSRIILRLAEGLHKITDKLCKLPISLCLWGGVVVIEAEKQVYSAHLEKQTDRQRRGLIYSPVPNSFGSSRDSGKP